MAAFAEVEEATVEEAAVEVVEIVTKLRACTVVSRHS